MTIQITKSDNLEVKITANDTFDFIEEINKYRKIINTYYKEAPIWLSIIPAGYKRILSVVEQSKLPAFVKDNFYLIPNKIIEKYPYMIDCFMSEDEKNLVREQENDLKEFIEYRRLKKEKNYNINEAS